MKTKVAVLVSGGGTNLQALIDYQIEQGEKCPYEIVIVISDHKDIIKYLGGKEVCWNGNNKIDNEKRENLLQRNR